MTYLTKPKFHHPSLPKNALGFTRPDYEGSTSTLCAGCGHDSISNQIISVAYELGLPMHNVAKFSGIGCSSKTPAYFLKGSHGFNSVHGRMPSVATGASLANAKLTATSSAQPGQCVGTPVLGESLLQGHSGEIS